MTVDTSPPLAALPKVVRFASAGIAPWPCRVSYTEARFTEERRFLLAGQEWPASLAACSRKDAARILKDMELVAGSNIDTHQLTAEQLARFKELLEKRTATPPPPPPTPVVCGKRERGA